MQTFTWRRRAFERMDAQTHACHGSLAGWEKPGVLCMFHWGAGMWALRHAQAHGMHANALVAPCQQGALPGRPVVYWYARVRTGMVTRVLKRQTLDVSDFASCFARALMQGEQILLPLMSRQIKSQRASRTANCRNERAGTQRASALGGGAKEYLSRCTTQVLAMRPANGTCPFRLFPQFETLEGAAEGFLCAWTN